MLSKQACIFAFVVLFAGYSPALAQQSASQPNSSQTPSPETTPSPSASVVDLATPIPGMVTVMIPKDEMLVVKTLQSLNSYSAHTGERIRYEIVQDFIVAGYLIAKSGDIAEGSVQEGQSGNAGGFYGIGYKAANLRVSIDRVYTFCGSTIELAFDRSEYRRRQGLFGSNKDVTIIKGQEYVPIVDHPQQACAVRTDAAAQPIPGGAIRADKG